MGYKVKVEFDISAVDEEVAKKVIVRQMNLLMDRLQERNQGGSIAVRVEGGDWIIRP